MIHFARSIGAAAAMLVAAIYISADDKKDVPFSDADFVAKAGSGGLHEVALGKLAASRAKNPDVKAFAERMIKDHSKANGELKKAADAAGFMVPMKMNAKNQKEYDRFKNYTGGDFDKEYISHMVKDHEGDVKEFTRATKEASNADVKAFAKKTLPVIEDHLATVKKLNEQMK